MAKELAWKASRAERPRGFESHALRHRNRIGNDPVFRWNFNVFQMRPQFPIILFLCFCVTFGGYYWLHIPKPVGITEVSGLGV